MRYEIFGDMGDIIASGFYKTFKDRINLFASAPNQLTARNLDQQKYGAEFEIRKPLNFVSDDVKKWRFSLMLFNKIIT